MSKIVVKVDSDLRDLMPGFLARKREDAEAIRSAADTNDNAMLANLGHRLKGEGGSYNLDGISEIGADLEHAAQQRDLAKARTCADRLIEYLDSVQLVFE